MKLDPEGGPGRLAGNAYNSAFRFGVSHAGNLRARGDYRHRLTKEACAVSSPVHVVSWGRIAQISRIVCPGGRERHLFKADREAAYKQLPLRTAGQASAIIALRRPASGVWFGFVSRTLMFGSVAAVVHYN